MHSAKLSALGYRHVDPGSKRTPAKRYSGFRRSASATAAQRAVYSLLSEMRRGSLIITDPWGEKTSFGAEPDQAGGSNSTVRPSAGMTIHHPEFFARLLRGGSLAFGESYVDRWWDVDGDRLVDLFKVLFANKLEYRLRGNLLAKVVALTHRTRSDPRSLQAAKRGVEAHYDLSNEFFALMLDETMAYSCGYQLRDDDRLVDLQRQKYDRICAKLALERGGLLLDIGCGWGGLLIHAARKYPGIRGVGITLSKAQRTLAQERIKCAGLSDRLQIELADYRKIAGSYDFIVSVGMFEHVGRAAYPIFFQTVRRLLKPSGLGLLHTIGLEEDPALRPDPWTQKYIFPGSRLPRLEELMAELRAAHLAVGHIESWRPHYAATLRRWCENFERNWPRIQSLGAKFDERFYRMWRYYLQISEAGFVDSTMELYQILFCGREGWAFPERFTF